MKRALIHIIAFLSAVSIGLYTYAKPETTLFESVLFASVLYGTWLIIEGAKAGIVTHYHLTILLWMLISGVVLFVLFFVLLGFVLNYHSVVCDGCSM